MLRAERRIHFNPAGLSESCKQGAKHAVFRLAPEVCRRFTVQSSSPAGIKNKKELKINKKGEERGTFDLKKKKKHLILPASGQKHGFLDEDGAGQQDVPATPNVIRAEREESSSSYKVQGFRTLLKSEWNRREIKALLDL